MENLTDLINDAKDFYITEGEEQKLESLLKSHDWYYQYSDDHSAWTRGNEKEKEIHSLIATLTKDGKKSEIEALWKKYAPKDMALSIKKPAPKKKPEFKFKSGAIKKKGDRKSVV